MEQRLFPLVLTILAAILTILVSGCRREEANPENLDPIYSDLSKEFKATQSVHDDSTKKLDGFQIAIEKSAPRTIERRNAEEDAQHERDRLEKLTEQVEYLKIRVERRRVEDLRDYKTAFLANKTWPDPKEYEGYLVNKRLMHASRNWNDRVPKLKAAMESEAAIKADEAASESAAPSGGGTKEGIHHN